MSAEFNASVTLAWSEYTARVGVDPSKFSDMEKIAFQAGFAAGISVGMDRATQIVAETLGAGK